MCPFLALFAQSLIKEAFSSLSFSQCLRLSKDHNAFRKGGIQRLLLFKLQAPLARCFTLMLFVCIPL